MKADIAKDEKVLRQSLFCIKIAWRGIGVHFLIK